MKIRAVIPGFLPVEEIKRRVGALLPGVDVVDEPLAPGLYPPSEIDVLILTTFHDLPADAIQQMTALKFIQVASTGYNRVALDACRSRGIMLSNIPVANSKTVAEHVVLMILALLRNLTTMDADLRRGEWPMLTDSHDLAGRTVGILGLGRIGKELAARLLPFEVAVVYYDVVRASPEDEGRLGVTYLPLEELLSQSDIVSLHLPLTEATLALLNAERLKLMKDGAMLINTARAELVDLEALRKEVKNGRLYAGLDVFPTEPPDFSDELFATPGTLFTPHLAGVTMEAQARFLQETVKNVLRYVQGKEPLYRVDNGPSVGKQG